MVGKYINIGINGYAGTFGSLYGVPQDGAGGVSWGQDVAGGYPFPPEVNNTLAIDWNAPHLRGLGFVADWDKNGWGPDDRGPMDPPPRRFQPGYSGDFFMPGEPYEGFAVQYTTVVGDTPVFANMPLMAVSQYLNFSDLYTARTESFTLTTSDDRASAMWVGLVGALKVTILTTLLDGGLYYTYTTTIKNVGDEALADLIFLRTIDPDNEFDYVRMLRNYTSINGLVYDTSSQDDSPRGTHHHHDPPLIRVDDHFSPQYEHPVTDDSTGAVDYNLWPYYTNNYVVYQPDGNASYAGPVPNAALVCACGDVMMSFLMCMGSVHPVAWASHGVRNSHRLLSRPSPAPLPPPLIIHNSRSISSIPLHTPRPSTSPDRPGFPRPAVNF